MRISTSTDDLFAAAVAANENLRGMEGSNGVHAVTVLTSRPKAWHSLVEPDTGHPPRDKGPVTFSVH